MDTLMIVEDEKLIRQGIRAIVERSGIEVSSICECRNGEEALDVLMANKIDIMITDLHMPSMDGLELTKRASEISPSTKIIVISGYDEFKYAVSLLRNGVRDYLVKPLSREKLISLLVRLNEEIKEEKEQERLKLLTEVQLIKLIMQNKVSGDDEKAAIMGQLLSAKKLNEYTVICLSGKTSIDIANAIIIDDINGHKAALCAQKDCQNWLPEGICAGVSEIYYSLDSLHEAYSHAEKAREVAFMRGETTAYPFKEAEYEGIDISKEINSIISYIHLYNPELSRRVLSQIILKAQNRIISPASFISFAEGLISGIMHSFHYVICDGEVDGLSNIWHYENVYNYYVALCSYISLLCQRLKDGHDSENRRKIMTSVEYLRQHYLEDVDMAVVSNYISMNYTQFSYLFKQYTGVNFLEYLKNLRIEESKWLLKETDLKVHDVCIKSGFKNEKHFMKVFKRSTGLSPSEYRKTVK